MQSFGISRTAKYKTTKGKKMKTIFLTIIAMIVFSGCSAKEFNEGVNSITTDITNAFEGAKDKSAD